MNFENAVQVAANRAVYEILSPPSTLATQTLSWMADRFDVLRPADYFTHLQSLPLLALPWWLEESLQGTVDHGFQLEIIYATINFYYFTRMLDDLMDGHAVRPAALPAMHAFHVRFIRSYAQLFTPDSSFWDYLDRFLSITCETAAAEAMLSEVTESDFLNIAARKTAAALIPVAAVCVRYDRFYLLPHWEAMFAIFGRWHQMRDDVLDWAADLDGRSPTWVLSEAKLRSLSGESVPA